eukprot:GEMP01021802.1.p1 GENE.GEMP01021802.1~~GEMP01021802.1.p1  ORF type:complete len:488 (+),score=66.96 GEMP01021802.1:194-1657(+)
MALWIFWIARMHVAIHHHARQNDKLLRSVDPEPHPKDRIMRTAVDAKATFPHSGEDGRIDGGFLIETQNTLSDQRTKTSTAGIIIGALIVAALVAIVFFYVKHKRRSGKPVKEPEEVGWTDDEWATWEKQTTQDRTGWNEGEQSTPQAYEVVDDIESVPRKISTTSGTPKKSDFRSFMGASMAELQENTQVVLEVLVVNARKLPVIDMNGQTNALCKIAVYKENPLKLPLKKRNAARITDILETPVKDNKLDPKWNKHFAFNIKYEATCHLYAGLYHRKTIGADELFAETSILVSEAVEKANYHELLLYNSPEPTSVERDLMKSRLYTKCMFSQANKANTINIQIQRGRKLPDVNPAGGIDAYMVIRASKTDFVLDQKLDPPAHDILYEGQSSIVSSNNPVWNTKITMSIPNWRTVYVTAILYSKSTSGSIAVGWFSLKLESLVNERLNAKARSYKLKNVPGSKPYDLKSSTVTLDCRISAADLPES